MSFSLAASLKLCLRVDKGQMPGERESVQACGEYYGGVALRVLHSGAWKTQSLASGR